MKKKHIDEVRKDANKALFKQESPVSQVRDESVHNAREALKQHKEDNFQPLLDALIRAVSILEDEYPSTDYRHPSKCGLFEAIGAAENVEVSE